LVSVLLPVIGSPAVYWVGRERKKLAGVLTSAILVISGIWLAVEVPEILRREVVIESYRWIGPLGLDFGLLADSLSLPIALAIAWLSALCALASMSYMENKQAHGAYYFFLLMFATGMVGTVLATNLLQFYLFWELMIIPSYFLIAGWGYLDPGRIGLKYFLWTRAGGLCLLFAILWLYSLTGSFGMQEVAITGQTVMWIGGLFMAAFFVKMAIFPLHNWLPDAHAEAPAPISAMLSGVMIKVGAYGVVRITLGMLGLMASALHWFAALAALTMLYGALMCLTQRDIKRLLAFSSISQMGLILFGLTTTDLGIVGALFHILNHAIAKGLLFIGAGALLYRLGTRDMDEMGGLARRMPITATSMALAAVALSATPPLHAFVSELLIVAGGLEAGWLLPTAVVLISSILTAGYFLWMLYKIFFGRMPRRFAQVREAPPSFTIPLTLLSIPIVAFGIWPEWALRVLVH
jgi:NADH-quinone oxidoreductase subunit M